MKDLNYFSTFQWEQIGVLVTERLLCATKLFQGLGRGQLDLGRGIQPTKEQWISFLKVSLRISYLCVDINWLVVSVPLVILLWSLKHDFYSFFRELHPMYFDHIHHQLLPNPSSPFSSPYPLNFKFSSSTLNNNNNSNSLSLIYVDQLLFGGRALSWSVVGLPGVTPLKTGSPSHSSYPMPIGPQPEGNFHSHLALFSVGTMFGFSLCRPCPCYHIGSYVHFPCCVENTGSLKLSTTASTYNLSSFNTDEPCREEYDVYIPFSVENSISYCLRWPVEGPCVNSVCFK